MSNTGTTYHIATMDCAAEESDIRRALEPIEGIRGLNFQLSARLLVIDAPDDVLPQALTAISKAGFNPKEVSSEDNHELPGGQQAGHRFSSGIVRLVLALVFAVVAECLSFFAPETQVWQISGMMIALIGIGLAGFDTYTKGFLA